MSEKVNKALINMLNELNDVETDLSKTEGSIFVKKCNNLIQEKISILYDLLKSEASSYGQKADKQLDHIDEIIASYKEKLNSVYDEYYLQYVNIQNEIGEARLNQKSGMINYQRVIDNIENGNNKYTNLKKQLKEKNNTYEKIINKCESKLEDCFNGFEKSVESNFLMETRLQVQNEDIFFKKIINKIMNLFSGNKKYLEALDSYEADVNKINSETIVKNLRDKTVDFMTEIYELKDVKLDEAV